MRPLIVDEKLRVFIEGRDDELMAYDGGDFYLWLKECEAGKLAFNTAFYLFSRDFFFNSFIRLKTKNKKKRR